MKLAGISLWFKGLEYFVASTSEKFKIIILTFEVLQNKGKKMDLVSVEGRFSVVDKYLLFVYTMLAPESREIGLAS